MPEMRTLGVAFDGLEALGQDYVYEGWLIVGDMPVSTGRFRIDADGEPDPGQFVVQAGDVDAATLFVLTIEPAVGDDPAPADTHVLAGDWDGDMADLSVGHAAALGTDLADAEGAFILETPTTADVADDYAQGIWWLDPAGGPGSSLALSELPEGWEYEGWVVDDADPISTGRF
ncbi:MAG: anti-sigma factor, partial [Planctomycetota bacterium]